MGERDGAGRAGGLAAPLPRCPPAPLSRRSFLTAAAAATLAPWAEARALAFGRVRADFAFTRLMYSSGNWDVDQRMPANLLNSLIEYTTVPVDPVERVVALGSGEVLDARFAYMAGHRLVQFDARERRVFEQYVRQGGFLFADDCNHDIDGLFARSFESQMAEIFGPDALQKLPNDHPIYRAFFAFPDGPPATSLELNGWGDDLVHDYLKAIVLDGRIAVLYSNKDYGCEWDYDFRNKRFYREDNTRFGVNIILHAMTA